MIVYRWEDDRGYGPYSSEDYELILGGDHCDPTHPIPCAEYLNYCASGSYRCGFVSIEQANNWFNFEERERLVMAGFSFISLEVPDERVQVGRKQCVYRVEDN